MGNVRFDPVFNIGSIITLITLFCTILGGIFYLGGLENEQRVQLERTTENRAKYIPIVDNLVAKSAAQERLIDTMIESNNEARADTRLLLQETARIRERLAAIEVLLNNNKTAQKE